MLSIVSLLSMTWKFISYLEDGVECTFSKFEDGTNLGGVVGTLKSTNGRFCFRPCVPPHLGPTPCISPTTPCSTIASQAWGRGEAYMQQPQLLPSAPLCCCCASSAQPPPPQLPSLHSSWLLSGPSGNMPPLCSHVPTSLPTPPIPIGAQWQWCWKS